jgi:hypothetical protein
MDIQFMLSFNMEAGHNRCQREKKEGVWIQGADRPRKRGSADSTAEYYILYRIYNYKDHRLND